MHRIYINVSVCELICITVCLSLEASARVLIPFQQLKLVFQVVRQRMLWKQLCLLWESRTSSVTGPEFEIVNNMCSLVGYSDPITACDFYSRFAGVLCNLNVSNAVSFMTISVILTRLIKAYVAEPVAYKANLQV